MKGKGRASTIWNVDAPYCQNNQPAPEESVERNKISPDQLHSLEDGKVPDKAHTDVTSDGQMKVEEANVEPSD